MNKEDVVQLILDGRPSTPKSHAKAFAPANIALIKYWGKRDSDLNLPVTSSLSFSLPIGTHTKLQVSTHDALFINGVEEELTTPFAKRLFAFLDLFRNNQPLQVHTQNEIPTAAGLASSASGFAACTVALNDLFGWELTQKELSILARLGSGSASRSIYSGFVEWHKGERVDGIDSFAEPLDIHWPEFRMGLWILSSKTKPIDSRTAMKETVKTSMLYSAWPAQVAANLSAIKTAISNKNFSATGAIAEHNALSMHATMLSANPSICYFLPETIRAMQLIHQLRKEGLELYFTMDAGPNLKILYMEDDKEEIQRVIPLDLVQFNKSF